jgi:hypothetical protein
MKRIQPYLFLVLIGLLLAGCTSTQTPQASAQLAKQFAGGPMPPDAQKKFQESMKNSRDLAQQHSESAAKQ